MKILYGLLFCCSLVLPVEYAYAVNFSGSIVLKADDNDGHDSVWQRRAYYGKPTWGIRGSHRVDRGWMWFDAFPGQSGWYCVSLGIIAENDGRGRFVLSADGRKLRELRFPYAHGSDKDCDRRGRPMRLQIGKLQIRKGDKITVYGASDYACGVDEGGAYALWHELVFTPVTEAGACPEPD